MIAESLRDKLRKVLAIAQSGQAGERDAASALLSKLLSDNGLTMEDIVEDEKEIHYFKTGRSEDMKALITQIYFMVANVDHGDIWKSNHHPGCVGFKVTKVQAADMESYYSVLAPAMKKEMERYRRNMRDAFFMKNGITSATKAPARELTPEEIEHMRQVVALQNAVKKVDFRRQIEG